MNKNSPRIIPSKKIVPSTAYIKAKRSLTVIKQIKQEIGDDKDIVMLRNKITNNELKFQCLNIEIDNLNHIIQQKNDQIESLRQEYQKIQTSIAINTSISDNQVNQSLVNLLKKDKVLFIFIFM